MSAALPQNISFRISSFGACSLCIAGIPLLILTIIRLKCTHYRITTKRVIVTTGWLNIHQTEIWIRDMRAVNLQRTLWDRIAGTGSVFIGTAATAGTEIQIQGIESAPQVVELLSKLRKR